MASASQPVGDDLASELMAHSDMLYRYAVARLGDRHTAEDLVQDTLVTAVGKIADFGGQSTLRTWLVGILRHKILDHYRWKQRHPTESETDDSGQQRREFARNGTWLTDPNVGLERLDDPGRSLERAELRAAIQLCIDGLPSGLHRVFVLREVEGLDPEETCEVAGIARPSLSVFLYRARQALRSCLQTQWVKA